MFHPDTQALIDRWTALAAEPGVRAGVPDRAAFAPHSIGLRLPRAFMAERRGDDAAIRLAGSWLESFHGADLRERSLLGLWRSPSRPLVAAAFLQASREARPVVVSALAGSLSAAIEIAFTPLRDSGGRPDLILGLYAPLTTFTVATDQPRLLTAQASMAVGEAGRAPLALAAVGGRRIA